MFHYFGRKKRMSKYYPEPRYNTIIEPFAGSAAYAMHYYDRKVILCELDPVIYEIWDYIINKSTPKRIMKFPLLEIGESLNNPKYSWMKQVEKNLLGFFIKTAITKPGPQTSTKKGFYKWNEKYRKQLSLDIQKVKHWKIIYGSYEQLRNYKKATWFIDPPYQGRGGSCYRMSNKNIDYRKLSKWCRNRNGQVIVCENEEAKWLPFKKFREQYQSGRKHVEVIWIKN
jgi:site-specific DNA-adenine methylase